MIKLILLQIAVLGLYSSGAFAQAPPTVNSDSLSEATDKSTCPSGICYNRVDPGAASLMSDESSKHIVDWSLGNTTTVPKEVDAIK